MIWKILAIAAAAAVVALVVWAIFSEGTLLPLLLAIPFALIARLAWARGRTPGQRVGP